MYVQHVNEGLGVSHKTSKHKMWGDTCLQLYNAIAIPIVMHNKEFGLQQYNRENVQSSQIGF